MMIIYKCDLCGKEIDKENPYKLTIEIFQYSVGDGTTYMTKHLHEKCKEVVISQWRTELSWQELVNETQT